MTEPRISDTEVRRRRYEARLVEVAIHLYKAPSQRRIQVAEAVQDADRLLREAETIATQRFFHEEEGS